MVIKSNDIVSISEARARLTEIAEEVVREGNEKVLTKNGASYVAIIDARRLDEYHAMADRYAELLLMVEARKGLDDIETGRTVSLKDFKKRRGLR